ncbi:MAG: sigma-70 family RNA polymerase sigma factor [Bacteroidia bacterium]|nr:sigma-70 family RNA polymerase sigma factor [Bacteroidia bacterium]MDW8236166.1 sigma-70 family RNA polymerase sigma factor [Bacteroidia bacterium]
MEIRTRGRKPKKMPAMTAEEKAAYDKLFEGEIMPHASSVYRFALQLVGDRDTARDLTQETLFRAYRFLYQYKPSTNAKAWLLRILRNTFINHYRKATKQPYSLESHNENSLYDAEDVYAYYNYQDPTEGLFGDEVTNALMQLPEDFRTIVILADVEGLSYKEISQILRVPIGTIRSRLHRARKILRELLADYAASQGYYEPPQD